MEAVETEEAKTDARVVVKRKPPAPPTHRALFVDLPLGLYTQLDTVSAQRRLPKRELVERALTRYLKAITGRKGAGVGRG